MSILNPKCQKTNRDKKPAALTADGYILPCCWLDSPENDKCLKYWDLKNKELLLSNNDSIKDIFESDQWYWFMNALATKKSDVTIPPSCLRHCGNIDV